MAADPNCLVDKLWNGDIPSTDIYRSQARGVLALVDSTPATHGQITVFPLRHVRRIVDLTFAERSQVDLVVSVIHRRMLEVYPSVKLVVEHTGGRQLEHAHRVVLPTTAPGQSDRLHHPDQKLARHIAPADMGAYLLQVQDELRLNENMLRAEEGLPPLGDTMYMADGCSPAFTER